MSVLRTKAIDLVANAVVQPTAWDATKPYLAGNMRSKLTGGKQAVGAALTKAIDVGNDFNLVPSGLVYEDSVNNRVYILTTYVTNQCRLLLYTIDKTTNVTTKIGQIAIILPPTPTFKELLVEGTGTTDLKVKILTTNTTALFGGLFITHHVDIADFQMVGFTTFNLAFGQTDAKATYKYVSSTQPGSLNVIGSGSENMAASIGMFQEGTVLKVMNGLNTVLRCLHFDQTTIPIHTATTVTITIASPGVVTYLSPHGRIVGDPVVFATTGALPTGIVAGTVYYIIAAGFGASSHQISATQGGAAINTSGTQSGVHTAGLPHGEAVTTAHLGSSGIVTPNLPATLLTIQNAKLRTMPSGPNVGQSYIEISSTGNLNRIKTADLAIGSTSFPSQETVNILSTNPSPLITAASNAYSIWIDDPLIDRWIFSTNTMKIVEKPFINNTIYRIFGSLFNRGTENQNLETLNFGGLSNIGMQYFNGTLYLSQNTASQRGVLVMDYKSDAEFDYSYILSPVITVNKALLCFINTHETLFDNTGNMNFYYKTSGFSGAFSGFTEISTAEELALTLGDQVQFAVKNNIALEDASTPAQILELLISLVPVDAMDDHWKLYQKYSSDENDSPFYASFRLQNAYEASEGGMPSELVVDMIDDSNNIVSSYSTVTNIANFSVSTNDGTSFSALVGVPSNTQYLILRCLVNSPAAGKLRARIRGV